MVNDFWLLLKKYKIINDDVKIVQSDICITYSQKWHSGGNKYYFSTIKKWAASGHRKIALAFENGKQVFDQKVLFFFILLSLI